MSSKVGYTIMYVAFLGIFVYLTTQMGLSVLNITNEQLAEIPVAPPNPTLLESLTFLFSLTVFGIQAFSVIVTVSSEFLLISIFVIVPLTAGYLWAILELGRGN